MAEYYVDAFGRRKKKSDSSDTGIGSLFKSWGEARSESMATSSMADELKANAQQPAQQSKTKISVGGKDIELDEETKKNWFKLNEEAKKALKDRLGEETFNQLKSTLDKEAPKQGIFDKITDKVNANSEMDKFKRTQQGQNADYRTAQREAGQKDYTNPFQRVAFQVAEPVARGVNTLAGASAKFGQGVSDLAGVAFASDDEERRIALERAKKRSDEDIAFSGKGGLLGVGANFQNAKELEDKKKLAGTAIQTGADLASVLPTGSAAKTGATLTSSAVRNRLVKEISTNVVAGLASEGGRQLKEGKFDAKALATGAAMDAALPVGLYGAGRAVRGLSGKDVEPLFGTTAKDAIENLNKAKAQRIIELGRNTPETDRAFLLDAKNPVKEPKAGYRSAHQIDSKTARNLGDMQSVDDVVTQIKSKYGLTNYDQKDITNLKKIVGNPEADVKIYRASPVNEVNDGDWVTTSKTYADDIKRQNGGRVYEYTVKAKELNLPQNIEDNPSLARFSAFQYKKATQSQPPKSSIESLKQEARRYKSAEEFVDSKINSYHQTDAKFDKFENTNQPFRFSGANFFLDTKPPKTVKKYLVEANTNLKNPLVIEDGNITQPMVDKAIKDGYDGIINKLPEGNGFPKRNEIAVFNPETIQTRQQLTDLYNQATKSPTTTQTIQTGFTRPTEAPVQPKVPLSPTAKRIAQIDKINASVQKNGSGSYTPEQLRGLMRERKELIDGTKFKSDVSSSVDSALSDAPITNTPKTMVQLTGDNAFRKFESKIVPAIKHIIKGSDSTARGKMFNRFAEQMSDDLVAINSVAKYMEETGRAPRGSYDAMIGMERKAVRSAADTQRWIEADSGWNRSKQAIYDNAKDGETLSSLRLKYDEYTKAYSELQIHNLYEKTGGKAGRTHTPEELADLRSKVAEFDSPGAREYAQGIVELYRNWLKSQLDEGEITPETYKTLSEQPYDYIKQQYEFTPEERAALAGKQPSNKPGRILKRQKETVQREMLSPAETMMATIQKGMAARAENNLKNQFVDIMLAAGDTGIRRVEKASPTKNHFTTVRNGKEVIWEAPAEIAKAFDNLKPNQLGAMMNAARAINNVTKFGITSGNIGFSLLKNPPMDLARSLINSETPLAMLNPLNIASSVYNASGLSKRVLSDLQQKMYEDFMSRLGTESTRIQQYGKSPSASKVVMESVKQDAGWKKRGVNVAKNPKEFGKAITGTLKGVEKQLAKTEIATRFLNYQTAYKKAIKRNFSEADAIDAGMQAAIGNTTEFLAGGVFSKNANAWVKYFNAPIQGSRAFARAFEKRPITTTAKMFTTVGLPMMLLTANNTETPEKLAIYNEISDIDKENYHIYISDGATYDPDTRKFTGVQFVRKPNDISAWFSGVQKSIERLANDEPAEHGKLLQFFTDTASSIRDNAPLPTTQKGLVGAVAGPATPIVEDLTNRSIFYGNDLVPEALRTSVETPEEQRYKNYSRTSKFLGGLLGKSPLVIDNYIRGYGGEVGTNIQNLIDRATGGRTDLVNEKGETYSDIGGKSFGETLNKAAGGRSGGETSRQFWEQIGGKESPAQRAKNKASKKVTAAVEAKDYVRAARLAREYNETVAGRVTPFLRKYQNSPSWDPDWDEYINNLFISDKLPALKRRGND